MPTGKNKNTREQSRLNFRFEPENNARAERAAAIVGKNLPESAVSTPSRKVDEVLERDDRVRLGSDDYRFFLDALNNDVIKEPSEKSQKAADTYRRLTRKSGRGFRMLIEPLRCRT